MSLAYTMTPHSINILLDGRMRTVSSTHVNYERVRDALKRYAKCETPSEKDRYIQDLRELVDIPSFISKVTEGRVQVGENAVQFDGKPVHGVIADRILDMLRGGFDVRPMARFLDRLMNNPSETARKELYLWLEAGKMPITEDGYFLAFKKVRDDYRSIHVGYDESGRQIEVWNHIGTVVQMPREQVDPDRNNTCSTGLHFCSYDYLSNFGGNEGTRIVILKIDPADVVSIPSDYSNTKGRTWRYEVIGEVPEDEAQKFFRDPVVSACGTYRANDGDGWEDFPESSVDDIDEELGTFDDIDEELGTFDDIDEVDYPEVDDELFDYPDDAPEPESTAYYPDSKPTWDPVIEPEPSVHDWVYDEAPKADAKDHVQKPKAQQKSKKLSFTVNGQKFTAKQLIRKVGKLGQRGFARMYGVSRTTLQGWLRKAQQS